MYIGIGTVGGGGNGRVGGGPKGGDLRNGIYYDTVYSSGKCFDVTLQYIYYCGKREKFKHILKEQSTEILVDGIVIQLGSSDRLS